MNTQKMQENNVDLMYKQRLDRIQSGNAVYYQDYIERELSESETSADMGIMLGAGTDTTSSCLTWAITLLSKYQQIQKLVREELMQCYHKNDVGDDDGEIKKFRINWINQLVYFRAFIYEVLRVSSVIKFGAPHCASDDILIKSDDKEICIPKGTIIICCVEFLHKNASKGKEHWKDSSDKMCLENWINCDTKKFEMNESFMTFGSGRRDCVGRTLAIKEMYIVMAYLLMNYRFSFKNKADECKPIQSRYNGVNAVYPPVGITVDRIV